MLVRDGDGDGDGAGAGVLVKKRAGADVTLIIS